MDLWLRQGEEMRLSYAARIAAQAQTQPEARPLAPLDISFEEGVRETL